MQGVHGFMPFRFLSRNVKKVTLCFSTARVLSPRRGHSLPSLAATRCVNVSDQTSDREA